MTNVRNIDDLINGITPAQKETPEAKPIEVPEASEGDIASTKETEDSQDFQEPEKGGEETKESKSIDKVDETVKEPLDVDEYGNEIQKPKMYTDEEVQRMIRDRLSRGQHSQVPQAQVQQAAQDFKADPSNPDAWEVQLEQFVEKTISKVTQKQQTQEWQQKEQAAQADFESKFSTGMNKYKDFHETVSQLPITDAMMVATREMKDPAAFIYAASKLHPAEVKRIAGLPNALQQAVEVGRLEEKMRKARNVTQAAKPLSVSKSDTAPKYEPKYSIDQLISKHAKSKVR